MDKYGVARNVLRALKFDGPFSERSWMIITRVRLFNVGLYFLAAKVVFSCPSVDRFGKKFWGLLTLV